MNDYFIKIDVRMILCMIDGKVCNALSNNSSSQQCYICGATPKIMNNPNCFINNGIDEKVLAFGISSLHAYIR